MTVEADIFTAVKSLVLDRAYRNIVPQTVVDRPYIVFQQVGGDPVNFVDPTLPSKKNARFQVRCWADDADAAALLARQVEDALRLFTALQTTVLTGAVSETELNSELFGMRQDFSFWF